MLKFLFVFFAASVASAQCVKSQSPTIESVLGVALGQTPVCAEQAVMDGLALPDLLDLEDLAWLTWLSKNWEKVAQDPVLAKQIFLSVQFEEFKRKDHDTWSKSKDFFEVTGALKIKTAIQGAFLKILKAFNKTSYDDFNTLSPEERGAVITLAVNEISLILTSDSYREALSTEFMLQCDEKIARIFGGSNPKTVAAASGYERAAVTKNSKPFFRFHLVSNAHVYVDLKGDQKTAPLYAPPGWTVVRAGKDVTNSSYVLHYPRLGRRREISLNVVHLADTSYLFDALKRDVELNEAGSIRIGSMGGPGGGNELNTASNYAHSHLTLWSTNGLKRYSFMDTFCR